MSNNERKLEFQTFRIELGEATNFSNFKKNRINQSIKSLRVGLSSSPNVILRVKFKEGDELALWPGRIINLSQASEGCTLSWDAQVNEWLDIEISESGVFNSGDYRQGSSSSPGVGSSYRKNEIDLNNTTAIQIASSNEKRVSLKVEGSGQGPIFVGDQVLLNSSISSMIRKKTCFKIMPYSTQQIDITGELWAIVDNDDQSSYMPHSIIVTEILK